MHIDIIKYDYTPASGKQYDVRISNGANQRYVEFTRAELLELREKIDSVLSDENSAQSKPQLERNYVRHSSIQAARAEAAERNAQMFGTDPSWYGF